MQEYEYRNKDHEEEYMGREYTMEITVSGRLSKDSAPPSSDWNFVDVHIEKVQEWKNGYEYLEPVTDQGLIKEIKDSIDGEYLLGEHGKDI